MAAQKGREVLVKVDDGTTNFITVAGGVTKSLELNASTVDISDSDSTNQWRELGENMGIRNARISISGPFKDSAAETDIFDYFMAGTIANYQFVIPDFVTLEGPFQVVNLGYTGNHDSEAKYTMTFESAGEITSTTL